MKYLTWLLKAAIFFTLFAFALNNQQVVAVNFFFGTSWKTHLVLVVLAAFSVGLLLGVLIMMPRWWRTRKHLQLSHKQPQQTPEKAAAVDSASTDGTTALRHGL